MMEIRSRLNFIVMTRKERIRNAVVKRRTEIQRHVRNRMTVHYLNQQRNSVHSAIEGKTRSTLSQQSPKASSVSRVRTEEHKAKDITTKSRSLERNEFEETMENFLPDDWLDYLHMSKDSFDQLCGKLRPELEHRHDLPLRTCVAVTLVQLATGMGLKTLAARFQMDHQTAEQILRKVCVAIVMVLKPLYIRWPGEEALDDIADQFKTHWGFPHCVGVLGSLHVPARPRTRDRVFLNSQGWSSVVMQAVVNQEGRFWDVSAGLPGGTDDSGVLRQSELWREAEKGLLSPQPSHSLMGQPVGYVLLGNQAYPLRSWLLKCYPESPDLTEEQHAFNTQLSRSRSPIESAFLRLRARWRCLHMCLDTCLFDHMPAVIQACCVLHNMCEINGDPLPTRSRWPKEAGGVRPRLQPRHAAPGGQDEAAAEGVRSLLSRYIHQQARLQEPAGDGSMQTPRETESRAEAVTLTQTGGHNVGGDCIYVVPESVGSVSCPVS